MSLRDLYIARRLGGGGGSGENLDKEMLAQDNLILALNDALDAKLTGTNVKSENIFNIAYGEEAPTDTSKLWCKCAEPSKVVISPKIGQMANTLSTVAGLNYYASTRCARIENIIYIFGSSTSSMYTYNLENNVLSSLAVTMPTSGFNSCGVVTVGSKIYIFGGSTAGIYIFDPKTTEFTKLDDISSGYSSAVLIDSKVYLIGNGNNVGVFDLDTKSLTTLSSVLPQRCGYSQATAVGKKIYIFGGYYYYDSTSRYHYNHIIAFDTETNTAKIVSTMPMSCSGVACMAFGSKIYAFGGYVSSRWSSYYATIQCYDVETNTNTTLEIALPIALGRADVCLYGTDIYVIGGDNGSYVSANIYKLALQTEIESGTLHIVPDVNSNIAPILVGNPYIELGVGNVLLGNADNVAEPVEAYRYVDGEWLRI